MRYNITPETQVYARVECTEFNSPGKWPVVARFVVETRPDDGAVEIVHWRVERVRQG